MTTEDHAPDVDVPALHARLLALRTTLQAATESASDSRKPVELDQTSVGRLSRMDAIQLQAMALAAERQRGISLARIEAALARIAAGAYGWCIQCGEPVAPARLEVDPAAPDCIDCARKAQPARRGA